MANETPDSTQRMLRKGLPDDKRILGDRAWVHSVLHEADTETRFRTFDDIIRDVCERHKLTETALASRSRCRRNSSIRAEIALAATESNCTTVTEIARRFNRVRSGLSRAMNRLRDKNP